MSPYKLNTIPTTRGTGPIPGPIYTYINPSLTPRPPRPDTYPTYISVPGVGITSEKVGVAVASPLTTWEILLMASSSAFMATTRG